MRDKTPLPQCCSALSSQALSFCTGVIDSSGVAERLEAVLSRPTGRRRNLHVRALLVALLCLAIDDRPLHLKAATKLLFSGLDAAWREELGVVGKADDKRTFLARYRQVRYLFHLVISVVDPSCEPKDRLLGQDELIQRPKPLSEEELTVRRRRLVETVNDLLTASVKVCSDDELQAFDGSVGLDATPVPLWSRGPSVRNRTCASDPDGGWYVREGDHRELEGPKGKKFRKLCWALEATIVTMGRAPRSVPVHPNLAIGLCLGRPGEDPAGTGAELLGQVQARGWPARYLGADRGYTQGLPERFHLPARALGYSLVMDYKAQDLGRQANSQGAVLVDGAFYCPAMPEVLVTASADRRRGAIDGATYKARIAARANWRLSRKAGPDQDGYERFSCPALGRNPRPCCRVRQGAALGKVPVLFPPKVSPKICTQETITIAPDIGARWRQDLAFGSERWASTYASYRNTIEGLNGYAKDPAHEALSAPGRRRVRGIAAQSLFVTLLLMAVNFRKIAAFRQMRADGTSQQIAQRARRRRSTLASYRC